MACAQSLRELFEMVGAGTDRTKDTLTGGPAIVLVRPQLAVNIGMCARAMVNFGLSDLRLVAPREGWPREDNHRDTAYAAAAGAAHLLDSARVFDTVKDAIADLNVVFATTARERGQGKPVLTPVDAMAQGRMHAGMGQKIGVMFGPERTGMDNDEISLATAIVSFPVNPAYASLNLAQAVLLIGYEWMRVDRGDTPPIARTDYSPPAPREMVLSFFEYLEGELEKRDFFKPVGKAPIMRRNLRNMFHRMDLTEQDVRTMRGAMVRLVEGARTDVQTRKRIRPPKGKPEITSG
jgi:tRNA/rRNA methyltransferase